MNEEFDFQAKLGSLFEGLNGIDLLVSNFDNDLPVADLDLPIRIGNSLHRGGINNLQQILAMSGDEIMYAISGNERRKQETFWYLISRLGDLDNNPKWSKAFLEWSKAHNSYDWDEINCEITDISDIFQI